eukprot:6880365-Pyramimonas_sp.AAC.1
MKGRMRKRRTRTPTTRRTMTTGQKAPELPEGGRVKVTRARNDLNGCEWGPCDERTTLMTAMGVKVTC